MLHSSNAVALRLLDNVILSFIVVLGFVASDWPVLAQLCRSINLSHISNLFTPLRDMSRMGQSEEKRSFSRSLPPAVQHPHPERSRMCGTQCSAMLSLHLPRACRTSHWSSNEEAV